MYSHPGRRWPLCDPRHRSRPLPSRRRVLYNLGSDLFTDEITTMRHNCFLPRALALAAGLFVLFLAGGCDAASRAAHPRALEGTLIYTQFDAHEATARPRTMALIFHDLKTGHSKSVLHSSDVGLKFFGATSISQDGKTLVVEIVGRKNNILLLDTRNLSRTYINTPVEAMYPRLSPSQRKIVFYGKESRSGPLTIWIYDMETRRSRKLPCSYKACVRPVWGESDSQLYYAALDTGGFSAAAKSYLVRRNLATDTESVIHVSVPGSPIAPITFLPQCKALFLSKRKYPEKFASKHRLVSLQRLDIGSSGVITVFQSPLLGEASFYADCESFFAPMLPTLPATYDDIFFISPRNDLRVRITDDRLGHAYLLWHPKRLLFPDN